METAAVSDSKDPAKVRAGTIGARSRWAGHTPAIVRLDELTHPQRRLVLALVEAAKNETSSAVSETPAEPSAHGVGRERVPR